MRTLIALHGEMGSGKDTVADYLVEHHGFTKFAFADKLREMALALDPMIPYSYDKNLRLSDVIAMHGWRDAKDKYPEVRRTLQRLGTEVIRDHVSPNFWVDIVSEAVRDCYRAVVTDLRFPNEGAWVQSRWDKHTGTAIWWVTRPDLETRGDAHISEEWHPDLSRLYVRSLVNDGDLERLYGRAADLLPTR